MSIGSTGHVELRPPARVAVSWNPNTGALEVEAGGANVMEQIGMLHYAITALQKNAAGQGGSSLLVPSRGRG